jgi:hypothetical protein
VINISTVHSSYLLMGVPMLLAFGMTMVSVAAVLFWPMFHDARKLRAVCDRH